MAGDTSAATRPSSTRWIVPAGVASVCVLGGGFAFAAMYTPYKQPSGSMWPTFELGAHVTANRLDKTPTRGQVVVFEFPERREQLFFKRVVGMPGDVVETKNDVLVVNGWEVPHCVVGKASYKDTFDESTATRHDGELVVEFLGDATYLVFHDAQALAGARQGPFTVKPGEYFVMGDNRGNSHDSRMWWSGQGGGVPADHVVGRVRGGVKPNLPRGSESLGGALDACLAKRPAQTSPPAPP